MMSIFPSAQRSEEAARSDAAPAAQPELAPDLAAPLAPEQPQLPRANPALDINEAAHRLADLVEQARAAGYAVSLPCSPAALRGVSVSETGRVA